jgi:O-antigen/teichoic acid export membrane protein
MIIAREDMNIYAWVSITEAVLKLAVILLLHLISFDKLQLYGILLCAVAVSITAVYWAVCVKRYPECAFKFYWNKQLFKEITSYTGWNLFGAAVGVFKFQLVNILLNQFFNLFVIAARGIAAQVNSAVISFAQSFSTAMRPQIIKTYAAGQKEEMLALVFRGSKGTFFLMYMFTLPLVLEMPFVLSLWLKNPPEYAALFTRLTLIDALIDSINSPFMAAAQATGKIKVYQSVLGGILLLNLPASWIALYGGAPAWSVMVIAILLTWVAFLVRLVIVKRLIGFSFRCFITQVMIPIVIVSILSLALPLASYLFLRYGLTRLLLEVCLTTLSIGSCAYMFGLNQQERRLIRIKIAQWFRHS